MIFGDVFALLQIGNRPGHTQNPVMASGREGQRIISLVQQRVGIGVQHTEFSDLGRAHLGVAADPLARGGKTGMGKRPGPVDPLSNDRRGLPLLLAGKLLVAQRAHLNLHINAV